MDLWKDKLNPEKSSLKSVLAAAEIIKITHSMTSRNEWSVKPQTVQQHGPKGNGSGSKPEYATATSQARNNDTWGGLNHETNRFNHSREASSFSQQTNEWKDQAWPNCDHWGCNACFGAKVTERTQLSKEEHDWRAAADLCFDCGELGHEANACPHKQTVSGSGSPKPPDKVSSYSMELGGTLRELQALADMYHWMCWHADTCISLLGHRIGKWVLPMAWF